MRQTHSRAASHIAAQLQEKKGASAGAGLRAQSPPKCPLWTLPESSSVGQGPGVGMLQWSQSRSCEGQGCPHREGRCHWGLGGSRGSQGWARGWAHGDPYPFRLVPHLQAEAGKVERRASHMQREARREETKREREKGRRGQTLVLSVHGCPGARGQSQTSFPASVPAHHQSPRATRRQGSTCRVTKQERQGRCLPLGINAGFHESWRKLQTPFLQGAWPISSTHRAGVPTQGEVSIPPHPEAKPLLALQSQEDTLSPLNLLAQGTPHRLGVGTSWPSPAAVWGSERGPQEQLLLQHSTWSGNNHTN